MTGTAAPPPPPAATPAGDEAGDITAGAPISPPPPAPATPVAVQQAPVNVSVSIRVESPGNSGNVTQVNGIVVDAPGGGAPGPATTGARSPDGTDIAGDTGDQSRDLTTDTTSDSPCDLGTGCCSLVVLNAICIATDATDISFADISALINGIVGDAFGNSNSTPQIPSAVVQLGPVNLNISIRIQSPGDDGAVLQTNIVQVRTVISPVLVTVSSPVEPMRAEQPIAAPEEAPVATASSEPVLAPSAAAPVAMMPPVAPAQRLPAVRIPIAVAPISLPSIVISAVLQLQRPQRLAWMGPAVPEAPVISSAARSEDGHGRNPGKAPSPAPAPPPPAPLLLAASVAPAPPGGGGGGGGLPLALAIPFAVGLIDVGYRRLRASRRVPSEVGGQRPERPG